MSVIAGFADEYKDPATNVIYTYEPGQSIASVKAGHDEVIDEGYGYESEVITHPGSPDAAGDVVILDKFTIGTNEYVVTSIGEFAFWANNNIKSVIIPESVTGIGAAAFEYCDSLSAVQLPEGLTRIPDMLFYDCCSLVSLTLPSGLSYIGRHAFQNTPWYSMQYNEASDGLFYIGPLLVGYKGDAPTGDLVIKGGTTCIGTEALRNCYGLTSVTIPESVAYIDYESFYNCKGLTAVHITNMAAWCNIEFQEEYRGSSNPLFYAHHLYLNGEEVTDLVIPDGVTSIGRYAFDNCMGLTSVTIPEGVTRIGSNAFRSCGTLTSVTIPPSIAIIESNAFLWCRNLNAVHISDIAAWCGISFDDSLNPLYYGAHLYLNGEEVKDLVIPEGVVDISNSAFMNCSQLTSVTIPESVNSIGEYAFNSCSEITRLSLPTSLNSIGYSAFAHCSGLTGISIPEGITSISESTFNGCSGLTSIAIPESVSSIGHGAFGSCSSLTSITIPNKVTSIDNFAFAYCKNLTDFYCHADDVPSTVERAFYDTPIASATLHVPAGSIDKYKATSPWSEFGNIVALSPDLTQIRIKDRPGETLEYIGKIGDDFDTALDSLRILKNISSEIEKEPLEVIFDYDNRLFFGIIYGDCAMYSDVLDTKGNYYLRTWYSSDETSDPVTFTAGQMATIILPSAPDASKGKYYRLDRCEKVEGQTKGQIVFEQELQPRARVPYIIVPSEDFSIDPNALDLEGLQADTVSIGGISFIGSYVRKALPQRGSGEGAESFYIDIIDTTPDCSLSPWGETEKGAIIGALRAYLLVSWSDPYNPGGTRGPNDKLGIVLKDDSNGMIEIQNSTINNQNEGEVVNGKWSNGKCYDLSGRKIVNSKSSNGKSPRGIYIIDGKKKVSR